MLNSIICGDSLTELKKMPDNFIQCCITSPPYYGLRDYGVSGQLGLEKTPEEYVDKMVEIFREVRRVLKLDGTLWLNLGDSYNSAISNQDVYGGRGEALKNKERNILLKSLKPKDLIGIPWRVAFALQKDGWYLRQDIIWSKPNPMPESVTDRCTKAHEYIFLLAKSAKYYYDAEAIKEKGVYPKGTMAAKGSVTRHKMPYINGRPPEYKEYNGFRNKRSVWTITTKPFKDAHFATFPPDLITPIILAGTSERGNCPECGKSWERIIKHRRIKRTEFDSADPRYRPSQYKGAYEKINGKGDAGSSETTTIGWQPTCSCGKNPVPAIIIDPFMGSGTTAIVSRQKGRNYIGIELNQKYIDMANRRLSSEEKE